jgi:hypothetical protein
VRELSYLERVLDNVHGDRGATGRGVREDAIVVLGGVVDGLLIMDGGRAVRNFLVLLVHDVSKTEVEGEGVGCG